MSKYKRDYFEEMNIDYEELKDYKDVETYYDEIQDFTNLLKELQCDRVECQKYIVRANKEIERLNNVIDELEKWLEDEANFWKQQQEKAIKNGWLEFGGKYNTTIIYENVINKLKKLKEGK